MPWATELAQSPLRGHLPSRLSRLSRLFRLFRLFRLSRLSRLFRQSRYQFCANAMSHRFQRGIWWVKRDFRLADNDALLAAISQCERICAVFVLEPSLCRAQETSQFHYHAWQCAATHLSTALNAMGAELNILCGEAVDVFEYIRQQDGFDALFSHEETGSDITFTRDKAIKQWAAKHQIHWHEAYQNGVIRGLVDRDKRQPVIRERLMSTPPAARPSRLSAWAISTPDHQSKHQSKQDVSIHDPSMRHPSMLHPSIGKVDGSTWPAFEALSARPADERIKLHNVQLVDELSAQSVLSEFLGHRGIAYSGGISSPNTAFEAGSRLSAHLAWGTISLRQVFHATWERDRELASSSSSEAKQWRKSLKAFQSRLHWHDHFIQRLESAPEMEFKALNPAYEAMQYTDNTGWLDAWEQGRTGLPLVDACMRCLAATGFLNFRMRAMVVSTGCFGLAQSWKQLYYPLARVFLDYEPGIHFSQIQMQAGIVGINTLRVYSPHKQLLDQDPQARFVKRWVPELKDFDAVDIAQYQERSLGDYPSAVADFKANTKSIRDQVYAIRKSQAGQEASAETLRKHGSRLPGNDRQRSRRKVTGRLQHKAKRQTGADEADSGQMTMDFD